MSDKETSARLETLASGWRADIHASHDALSQQMGGLRQRLDRLLDYLADATPSPTPKQLEVLHERLQGSVEQWKAGLDRAMESAADRGTHNDRQLERVMLMLEAQREADGASPLQALVEERDAQLDRMRAELEDSRDSSRQSEVRLRDLEDQLNAESAEIGRAHV